ncbi:unnamed protein product [Schistocephalus solidus]|uniref:Fis family transcriptional regulator n=1 Tax=Schistocephalus solidus TaxID=70667 RepID=A0A183T0S1_SCHSO|nr:unnamed protein product [Schistocephalus solidus]
MDRVLVAGLSHPTPFNVLCDQLKCLFHPPLLIEEAIHQIFYHRLQARESPRQVADTLLGLTRVVYHSLATANRDEVVHYHFKWGQGSKEVAYFLQIELHGDLQEAILRAARMLQTDPLRPVSQPYAVLQQSAPGNRS